jgi:hypothetical protein
LGAAVVLVAHQGADAGMRHGMWGGRLLGRTRSSPPRRPRWRAVVIVRRLLAQVEVAQQEPQSLAVARGALAFEVPQPLALARARALPLSLAPP